MLLFSRLIGGIFCVLGIFMSFLGLVSSYWIYHDSGKLIGSVIVFLLSILFGFWFLIKLKSIVMGKTKLDGSHITPVFYIITGSVMILLPIIGILSGYVFNKSGLLLAMVIIQGIVYLYVGQRMVKFGMNKFINKIAQQGDAPETGSSE